MNDNDTICKNCNAPKGWHIIPKLNCPGSRDGTYQGGMFFEPISAPATPPEQKQIDRTLSPALVKGEQDARETLDTLAAAHQRIIDLENLLMLALPCVEESEEFNKPNRRTLSAQIREEIA